jgi:DNA (cytosine-5)-methyltransferase 1
MEDPDEPDEAEKAPAYARKSGKHKGSNAGLKAFVIAQITSISTKPSSIKVRRFYRPEDVGRDHAYSTEWWEVYAGPDTESSVNDLDKVLRKCSVKLGGSRPGRFFQDEFVCTGTFDPSKASTGASSSSSSSSVVTAPPSTLVRDTGAAPSKAKGKPSTSEPTKLEAAVEEPESTVAMRSMDIFAGCGGLSEGMHQAGVAVSHWAIEYEPSAAEAFKLNNPEAATFCNNCNVLLRAAMEKAGQVRFIHCLLVISLP